jgi:hypothetical protein
MALVLSFYFLTRGIFTFSAFLSEKKGKESSTFIMLKYQEILWDPDSELHRGKERASSR